MDRIVEWFRGAISWLRTLTPKGRAKMIAQAREEGAFSFASQLAKMNRETRRRTIREMVKALK
jgi:hypothetical protein